MSGRLSRTNQPARWWTGAESPQKPCPAQALAMLRRSSPSLNGNEPKKHACVMSLRRARTSALQAAVTSAKNDERGRVCRNRGDSAFNTGQSTCPCSPALLMLHCTMRAESGRSAPCFDKLHPGPRRPASPARPACAMSRLRSARPSRPRRTLQPTLSSRSPSWRVSWACPRTRSDRTF